MPLFVRALENIIKGENNFCCLCLNNHDFDTNYEAEKNNVKSQQSIIDILHTLLGEEISNYLINFENICYQCMNSLTSCYSFIKTVKNNVELITKAIETLTDSLQYTCNNELNKSLYVAFNTTDIFTKQLYDTAKVSNAKAALKRFQILNKTELKPKTEDPKLINCGNENKKQYNLLQSQLQCKDCLKIYPSKCKLKNHMIKKHGKSHCCLQCSLVFSTKQLLEGHISKSHVLEMCGTCGKTFKNRHTLELHELRHNLTLMCPDCGRTYKSRVTFKKHIELNVCKQESRASPANAKFTCDYCNKKYTQKVSLRVHIQFEHGNYKVHVCEWCGKKFWAQSRLKAHIVKHTRERNYACTICDGRFVTKEALLYHTRLHTGEKPYKCSKCDCRFLSASRRSEHVKRHHSSNISNVVKTRKPSIIKEKPTKPPKLGIKQVVDPERKEVKTNHDDLIIQCINDTNDDSRKPVIADVSMADLTKDISDDVYRFFYQITSDDDDIDKITG